jgi:2-amino-4-hydroxy-6-hydroxymethyldihydropteridine diphosphokinase
MPYVFIGAGSNLGDRRQNLNQAKSLLSQISGVQFLRDAPILETEPVGGPPQGKYLNTVWKIETRLSPGVLLAELLTIEKQMGRVREEKNGPRLIDLDILVYGDEIISEPGLNIPHPRFHEREFVLRPLAELAPELMHPVLKKKVKELLEGILESYSKS